MHIIFGQYALHWGLWCLLFDLLVCITDLLPNYYYITVQWKDLYAKFTAYFYRTKGSQTPEELGTSSLPSVLCAQTSFQYRGLREKEVSGQEEHHRIQPIKSVDCLLQSDVGGGTPDVQMGGTMAEKETTSHQH